LRFPQNPGREHAPVAERSLRIQQDDIKVPLHRKMLKAVVQENQLGTIPFGRLNTKLSFSGDINRHLGVALGQQERLIAAFRCRHPCLAIGTRDPGDFLTVTPAVAAADNCTSDAAPGNISGEKINHRGLPGPADDNIANRDDRYRCSIR
jgi:hypothetical protein